MVWHFSYLVNYLSLCQTNHVRVRQIISSWQLLWSPVIVKTLKALTQDQNETEIIVIAFFLKRQISNVSIIMPTLR